MDGKVNKDKRYTHILDKIYPDKIVVGLQKSYNVLYQEIWLYAKENGYSIQDYISSLGFKYVRKNQVQYRSAEEIIIDLDKIYPDKIIVGLSDNHNVLYQGIRLYAKKNGRSIQDYISSLGYEYIRKNEVRYFSPEEIISELEKMFPNRVISSIQQIHEQNLNLYNSLRRQANVNGSDIQTCLVELGFNRKNTIVGLSKIIYDTISLLKLKNEFNINVSQLANWLGVSKQNLDQKMTRKRDRFPYWQHIELNSFETEIISLMIEDRVSFYQDEEKKLLINIYRNNTLSDCAILIINDKEVKCLFDIPLELKKKLYERGFYKYDNRDFDIIKELDFNCDLINMDEDGVLEIKIINKDIDRKIVNVLQTRRNNDYALSKKKYLEFLGFKIDSNKISDEEIRETLNKFRYEESNIIHIPSDDPEYHRIINLSFNRGFASIKDFIEFYGFEYKRFRITNYIDRVKAQIEQSYIVYDDKIYINSLDPLYLSLSQYTFKNNQKIDDLIHSLGFTRLKKDELPEGYIQFDWISYQSNEMKQIIEEEDFVKLLDERIIEGNQIYVSSYEPLYDKLFIYAAKRGISINDLVKSLGYERIYLKDVPEEYRMRYCVTENDEEDEKFISNTLEEVKGIQGQLESSTTVKEKVQRSTDLAQTMKKLYKYRCQLCCYDGKGYSSLPIEKNDGTLYVEVHHITKVSDRDKVDDETRRKIDTYENVVVVCPLHHVYLHCHHGGFPEVAIDSDGKAFFRSKTGEVMNVYTDYHLKYRNV